MPLTQLSVFIENMPGWMSKVITRLDEVGIKILALSIAEAGEAGLIRLIVDNPETAAEKLEAADFNLAKSRKNTEVTAVLITEENNLAKITKLLAENKVNIEYAYSFGTQKDKLVLILRVDDTEKAEKILTENQVRVLSLDDLKKQPPVMT